jgi:hypothetical protein
MKHHVSLALPFTLLAALTLALLPPIINEPHYLFHGQDDRTVTVRQSYAPLDMTELALINTASRTAEAPPEDGKYLRLPEEADKLYMVWLKELDAEAVEIALAYAAEEATATGEVRWSEEGVRPAQTWLVFSD